MESNFLEKIGAEPRRVPEVLYGCFEKANGGLSRQNTIFWVWSVAADWLQVAVWLLGTRLSGTTLAAVASVILDEALFFPRSAASVFSTFRDCL